MRRIDSAGEDAAGLHHLPAGVVDRGAGVMARANQRKLVGDLGVLWKNLGDLKFGRRGRNRLEGPRISAGASGFMSNVSSWLGAPRLKIMIAERSSSAALTLPPAFAAK